MSQNDEQDLLWEEREFQDESGNYPRLTDELSERGLDINDFI
jgi:hypothetical protein